ncbi:MAG: AAA ATPase [Candidatus Kaiserbacteria bacterium GW2011_GWC2_49_12]|uniref:AAA ATPase n=2 Tax=Parcubacteria group TaxID=1794811 RepID=A0A0G1WJK7_9BACT|nr:MAG: AAA ATPase [Parcubacteria group bacterium GW2011_GWA2_49_16]KKW06935.1 MAG: AAA ATPase [Candidatus Kaiserbacteria bacterium GW2011_GWC2_49_12]KKW18775.1 MAG: AAA ATPase [Candidatus Adlerbacteria bacterium GW2011_GWC1_50_9]
MLVGNAHVVAGNSTSLPVVIAFLKNEGIHTSGNPDVYVRSYMQFGADEARELKRRAFLRAVGEGSRIFVITTPGMTVESQNVLLKTLEEPPADAVFIFVVPSPGTLLSTFRSRCQVLELPHLTEADGGLNAKQFLSATQEVRLDMLKPLLEKNEDDKRDAALILAFLSSLEREMAHKSLQVYPREGIESVYRARKYVMDKGALVKPLLEQVAILSPRI